MSNMGYCRFRNTLSDLQDCYEHIEERDLSEEEERAKESLMGLCQQIGDDYGEDFE